MQSVRLATTLAIRTAVAAWAVACNLGPQEPLGGAPPVQGSVDLEGGACCLGAVAGEEVLIHAHFQSDRAVQMRVGSGSVRLDEGQLSQAAWGPFSATATFPYQAPIYSDDISVEGMPADYPPSSP